MNDCQRVIVCTFVSVTMATLSHGYSYTGERSIRTSVLSSFAYDRMARPNESTTALVGYNVLVVKNLLWNDERLMWNPAIYDQTEYIHALEEEIWKPEILVNNALEDVGLVSDDHLIYRIKYTGDVEWEPLVSNTVDCGIDVTYFPFDTQQCSIELTSWGLPDSELELRPLWNKVRFDEYRESETWEILSTRVDRSRIIENVYNITEYFSKVIFTIRMSRKPGNYVFNTLVPIIISSFQMAIINLIPLKNGERIVSGFLVLVINTLLLTIYMQQIPDIATTTALLGIYFTGSLCLDFVIVIITVSLSRLHHKSAEPKPVGFCLRNITLFLKKILCFRETPIEDDRESLITIPTDDLRKIEKTLSKKNAVCPEPGPDQDGFTETLKIKEKTLPALNAKYDLDLSRAKLRKNAKQKNDVMEDYIVDKHDVRDDVTWETVAIVFDRICFLFFLSVKIAYNAILIGNLFYQRSTLT